jgi:signal transduction histidine kinase
MASLNDVFLLTNGGEDYAQAVIVEVSAGFESATELPLADLIDKPCRDVFYSPTAFQVFPSHSITEAFQQKEALVTELHMCNAHGDLLRFNFSIKPLINDKGQVEHWLWQGTLLGLENMACANFADTKALAAMQLMASSLSHELNNIFAVVLGNADLIMSRAELNNMFVPLLQAINRSTTKGLRLTESLQLFAQKTADKKQEVVVDQLLASLELKDFGSEFDFAQRLNVNLHSQKCKIDINPQSFMRCIEQLLKNALQATGPEGKVSIESTLKFVPQQTDFFQQLVVPANYVQIKISDSGVGIAPQDLPNIFNPFFSTLKKQSHQGLGLSLVYGFLQNCQGYCFVSSIKNQGSTFTLLFKPAY